MSLLYGLSWYVDALYFFGVMGVLGLMGAAGNRFFFAPLSMFLGCALSPMNRKMHWAAPLAGIALALIAFCSCMGEYMLCLFPAVYLLLYVRNNRVVADYYYAARKFIAMLCALPLPIFIAFTFRAVTWSRGVLYLLLFFTLSIFLMRMLRHDDSTAKSARFRLMNLISVGVVCLTGWVLSQPRAAALLKAGWQLFRDHVLAFIVSILIYIVEGVMYALGWILARLMPDISVEIGGAPALYSGPGLDQALGYGGDRQAAVNPVARAIVIGLGIAALAAVVILVANLLSRQAARVATGNEDEERESLEATAPPAAGVPRRRGDSAQGVRWYYRKSLQRLISRGGRVSACMDTLQIRNENAEMFDPESLDALRTLYLPVRYGGREAGPEDVAAARAACDRLRKKQRQSA